MATAEQVLDAQLEDWKQARLPSGPPGGCTPGELRSAMIERLGRPSLPNLDMMFVTKMLEIADPAAAAAELERVMLDRTRPRAHRARAARMLAECSVDRYYAAIDRETTADDEQTLAVEGMIEIMFCRQQFGFGEDSEMADLLCRSAPGSEVDLAPLLEPLRRSIGLPASQAFREVLGRGELAPYWPTVAGPVAEEGSVEALAALDLALLVRPAPRESAAVQEARERLLQRAPALTAPKSPRGEFYLCAPDENGHAAGLVVVHGSATSQLVVFVLVPGEAARLLSGGTLPTEVARKLAEGNARPKGSIEAPLEEGLSLLRKRYFPKRAGGGKKEKALHATLREMLAGAGDLEPLKLGKLLSLAELETLFAQEPLASWAIESGLVNKLLQETMSVAGGSMKNIVQLARLSLRIELGARWLRWAGHAELAGRVAAHAIEYPNAGNFSDFFLFASFWVVAESKRFVSAVNAAAKKQRR